VSFRGPLEIDKYKYAKLLLAERVAALQALDVTFQQGRTMTSDYLSCRRSLLQAIGELETLIRRHGVPGRYDIDANKRVVRTVFSGSVNQGTVAGHFVRLGLDPAFHPEFSEIIAFEDISDIHLNYMDFELLVQMDPFSRSAKRALVIPERGALYGVARIYQAARHDTLGVRIFDTEDDALLWVTSDMTRSASP
jgi:hypothetical protein